MCDVRIALLPSAFHPSVGGVEELTRRLAGHLVRDGHHVEIWTSRREADDWPVMDRVDGIPVTRFTFPAPRADLRVAARWPRAATAVAWSLRNAVQRFQPDVLHVQCFSTNGAYATALSAFTGVPLVLTLQGETVMDDRDIYEHSAFLRTSLRLGLRRAAAVTGCSQYTLDDAIRRFGLSPTAATPLYNGVDLEEPGAPREMSLPFDCYIFAVGRMVPKKGFDLLLRAWARIADDHPGVGLVIGGDGSARHDLARLVEDLGLGERTSLPGTLDRQQVGWCMQGAEFFVMPSRVEPFGIVTLEAWRAGKAVVVTSRGGASEFVTHGTDGLVVDPHDESALAGALDDLLSNVARREQYGSRGRERVRDFAWPRITEQYLGVYEKARATAPRPAQG